MSKLNPYELSSKDYAKLYNVWKNMNDRCYNEKSQRYYTYGARGITVCQEWRENFHAFAPWALRNGWKPDLWIERKNVNGCYCPENCTFLGRKDQMRNRTNNVNITIGGETKCMAEWCEIFGCDFKKALARYNSLKMDQNPDADFGNLSDDQIWSLTAIYLGNEAFNRIQMDIGQAFEKQDVPYVDRVTRLNDMREYIQSEIAIQMDALRKTADQNVDMNQLIQDTIKNTFEVFEVEV